MRLHLEHGLSSQVSRQMWFRASLGPWTTDGTIPMREIACAGGVEAPAIHRIDQHRAKVEAARRKARR
jgi:hypothetical protein